MAAIYKEKAGREGRKPEIGTRQSTYNGDWYASVHVHRNQSTYSGATLLCTRAISLRAAARYAYMHDEPVNRCELRLKATRRNQMQPGEERNEGATLHGEERK